MNMRKNIVLVVGGGSCFVLLLMALFFLWKAGTAYREESRRLQQTYRQLAELHARAPFPSVENLSQEEKNVAALLDRLNDLKRTLARDPFPPDAREPADFSARVQRSIERFRTRATAAGIQLPDTLEAGFGQYSRGGVIPDPRYVPRLSRQLYSMERVTDVLIASGVGYIDALSRDPFETQPEAVPSAATRPNRRSRRDTAPVIPKQSARLVASVVDPNGLYVTERIGVSFTAKEMVVWDVLNRLAAASHFMVVSGFSFQTQTDIMAYQPGSPDQVKSEALKRYLSEGVLTGEAALSRPERIIAGDELLRVSLTVEVYNFEPVSGGGVL